MLDKVMTKWKKVPLEVKVSTAYAICSILQKCLAFITLPIFSRLLTTEQYGLYTIYTSWEGILCIFITLNLAYGSFSKAMVKYQDSRDEYISSIQGIILILTAVFLAIYLPLRSYWNVLFELPTPFILLMVAEIVASTAIQLWSGKKRFEYKYISVTILTLVTSFIAPMLAYFLVISNEEKGYARIVGYSGVTIVVGTVLFVLNMVRGKKFYDKAFWKYAFGFNIPLLVYYLSQVIFNQSDRVMISHLLGTGEAAIYGVAYNLAMILSFVLNAIYASYIPWMYVKMKENKIEENKPIAVMLAILLGLMILCVIWYAPEIIFLMAGEQYATAVYVVAPVAMSLLYLFYSQLFIGVEFYFEEKKLLVYASLCAALLNVVLNFYLVPIWGVVAAGYTTLFSYIVFVISNLIAVKIILKKKNIADNIYNYKLLFAVMVTFMASGFLGVALYKFLIPRIVITIVVFVIMMVFRNKFIDVLKKIKEDKKVAENKEITDNTVATKDN